jgi:hypothetical protein
MKLQWRKNFGSYYLYDLDSKTLDNTHTIICMTDEVGIAFSRVLLHQDKYEYVFMKHGDADKVSAWVDEARRRFINVGLQSLANELFIIRGSDWDPEDLNKILNCTGWISVFLKKHNIDLDIICAAS